MEISKFGGYFSNQLQFERLYRSTPVCDTYIVRLYGKLHFVKRLKGEYRFKPQYVAAFKKEFEIGYQLEHPAIPRYVSFENSNGNVAIVEEYIDGDTLADFLEHNPDYFKSSRNLRFLVDNLLSVLKYLHKHQILYLDLKPDNIIITSVGHQLKLVDFGGCSSDCFDDTAEMTVSFAAPEQLDSSKACDERTDIFLFGRILDFVKASKQYDKIKTRCLNENPKFRFQNFTEVEDALLSLDRKKRYMTMSIVAVFLITVACGLLMLPSLRQSDNVIARDTASVHVVSKNKATIALPTVYDTANNHIRQIMAEENLQQKAKKQMEAQLYKDMIVVYNQHLAHLDTAVNSRDDYSKACEILQEKAIEEERELAKKFPTVSRADIYSAMDRFITEKISRLYAMFVLDK